MTEFEYHTFLHHSQTDFIVSTFSNMFEYHTFLHHSQTPMVKVGDYKLFEYHTFLHHSQTIGLLCFGINCLSTIHFYIILKPQI